MKVRTKIVLLLFAVVAIFVGGLIGLKLWDLAKFRKIAAAREEARRRSFEEFSRLWSAPVETFTKEFSCLDKTVQALATRDHGWAEENLNHLALTSARANAVWLYHPDGSLFYSLNNRYAPDELREVPFPREQISALLDQPKLCHFFEQTPIGLMEIYGATVHRSADSARTTPRQGYLFAARCWGPADLADISRFTGDAITLGSVDAREPNDDARKGLVTFSRELAGWDGRPVARLVVRNESPVVEQLNLSSERLFLWLILFALVLSLLLLISLTRWVANPLKALSACLKKQDPHSIAELQNDRSEFGDFARLIRAFFDQRANLLREMSERRQTEEALHLSEERLRHSQKMEAIGRLAGGIAHDFNNLLTAIIGYAELITMRPNDSNAVRQDAELIHKAGEQAAALTRQLLAFSRKQLLQPRVIDLNQLVLEMKKLLQRVIGEHIDLRVHAEAESGRVRADPTQLEQVILNLGVNARDAMPSGGTLTIRTQNATIGLPQADGSSSLPPGRYVALTVQDTGCGMDVETKERIFEPFFTTKGPGKGTGLGLATVYGIVQQSGGGISVDSRPGEGTKFAVYLPCEPAPVEAPQEQPIGLPEASNVETILVVEDEEIVRDLVCAVLAEQGYDVLCADRGEEGLRMAREHDGPIHLLITDVIMPQMHGPELARALHRFRPETPVLFISGYSDNDISDTGVLSPDIRFLAKPFTPQVLGQKVREVLDEHAVVHSA